MPSGARIAIAALFLTSGAVAGAQLLPGGGNIGGVGSTLSGVGQTVSGVGSTVGGAVDEVGQRVGTIPGATTSGVSQVTAADVRKSIDPSLARLATERWIQSAPAATLVDLRRLRLAELVKQNSTMLEMDGDGNPARRGRLLILDPTAAQLQQSRRLGFRAISDEQDESLGIRTVTLATPTSQSTPKAVAMLRKAIPSAVIEFDHVFEPAGGSLRTLPEAALASSVLLGGGPLIGMVDGGVGRAPSLERATIEQRGFAGAAQPTGHGTAIASLIVGSDGKFSGAARSARLAVADVYGGNPAAGSATTVTKAMSWLLTKNPAVVNISLVGPRNRLVERVVAVMLSRGIKIVAAVGNDGPAAPALYPASQPGVIAVTAVDSANRALPEAGRIPNLAYAAPGADMVAALPGKGYSRVRGTSFAAPYVTARVAITGSFSALDNEVKKGRGRIGKGIVCATCRIAPKAVGLK